ncbi:PTS fructose transporter subunit EIIBC [Wohlfahrtiimonas chitiniclastica]|uniref:PTS fructose transporter subunit IIC n=1 Tax=Wohlfahrtiimonas chitiniclastica TaxID=400946 RepID=UPI000B985EB4|nr:fructose-specific PTS transporter subunit EIIC [Wohlfahrtiimonas chitiniclastica]OYQ89895.1 PTS fructose transporter subunit EIIBC [Wohlfahrtiimonas chitiniclastica]
MKNIWVILNSDQSDVKAILAKEALHQAAKELGHNVDVAIISNDQKMVNFKALPSAQDALILADVGQDIAEQYPQTDQKMVTMSDLLSDPKSVLQAVAKETADALAPNATSKDAIHNIIAVTSCPTGIAHTFMAAEGLQTAGEALGYHVRVETQGSVGAQDVLTPEEIKAADLVIIAADREVDRSRFNGKRVYASGTKMAISNGEGYIQKAIAEAKIQQGSAAADSQAASKTEGQSASGVYKHLMSGVSFMLPFVVAGGLLIALAFAFGGINAGSPENAGSFAHTLSTIGGVGFSLMVPALAGYIAFSIADRPGLAPGMIGGFLAAQIGSGFLGGIIAGFMAGYLVLWLNKHIKLHRNLEGLKPILILPLLGTLIVGLVMVYVIGEPVAAVLHGLESWLRSMHGASSFVIGAIIGGMMAADLGGPINKAAYATAVALIASGVYEPIAAVMAAGMVPPLSAAVATRLFKNKFTHDEYEAGVATGVLGLAFISEGAIPFAARDPFRVIPCFVAGSAVAGAISMALGCQLKAPHGGIFVLAIPGAVSNLLGYALAIVVGTVVSALLLGIVKKTVVAKATA